MSNHPAIQPGRVAVITGGAERHRPRRGEAFRGARPERRHRRSRPGGISMRRRQRSWRRRRRKRRGAHRPLDVSRMDDVQRLKEQAYRAFGEVGVLMNNAGTGPGGGPFDHYDRWQRVIGINLWGVINGVHAFAPAMIAQGTPAAIVNTGSKQGITCPPGDTAYNVSKAGVKVDHRGAPARAPQHARLQGDAPISSCRAGPTPGSPRGGRREAGGRVVAGPGDRHAAGGDRARRLLHHLPGQRGDECEIDRKRILWAAGDIAENRPPLSRWHPDYGRRVQGVPGEGVGRRRPGHENPFWASLVLRECASDGLDGAKAEGSPRIRNGSIG